MMRFARIFAFLALAGMSTAALAQTPPTVRLCNGTQPNCPLVSNSNPLPVSASVTASISGFHQESVLTPFSATTGGATSGAFTAGKVIVVSNAGSTNAAYCQLGGSATTSGQLIPPQSSVAFTSTSETTVTCATSTSTTTINVSVGTGLPTGWGGGSSTGGGSGGTSATDEAAFTYGSSAYTPFGGVYNSSITALTSGQGGAAALTPMRSIHNTPFDSGGGDMTDTTNHALKVVGIGIAPGTSYSTQTLDFTGGKVDTLPPSFTAGQIQPYSMTTDGGLRTALTAPTATQLQSTTGTGTGQSLPVQGYSNVTVTSTCSGTCTGVAYQFQVSEDTTNWTTTACMAVGSNTPSTTATLVTTGYTFYQCPLPHPWGQFRVNVTANPSSASLTVNGYQSTAAGDSITKVMQPYAIQENRLTCSGTTTGSTAATCTGMGAQGAGIKIYVTDMECARTDAGTSLITVALNDASTSTFGLPSGAGNNKTFATPLVIPANTALTFTPSSAVISTICNFQGYKGP